MYSELQLGLTKIDLDFTFVGLLLKRLRRTSVPHYFLF